MDPRPLPPGFISQYDQSTQRYYYVGMLHNFFFFFFFLIKNFLARQRKEINLV